MADTTYTPGKVTITPEDIIIDGWVFNDLNGREAASVAMAWATKRLHEEIAAGLKAAERTNLVPPWRFGLARATVGPIGDYRKSEAERWADHRSRCGVCQAVDRTREIIESESPGKDSAASLTAGGSARPVGNADKSARSGMASGAATLTDELADKILARLTTWRCDRCEDEATGGLQLPETWKRLTVEGADPLILCPACATSLALWIEFYDRGGKRRG